MQPTPVKAPDGGWGWAVVAGLALTNIFNNSLLSVFGLLFRDQLADLGLSTTGVALVLNLNIIVLNFTGFFTKNLVQRYSLRVMSMVGNALASFGICMSSRATSVPEILLFYGVCVGLGLGLMNSSGFLAVDSYFQVHRGKALGLALAGTGIGQMVMPFIVRYLLDDFGYRGATLIIGGLSLHGLVGASLYRPLERIASDEAQYLLEKHQSEVDECTAREMEMNEQHPSLNNSGREQQVPEAVSVFSKLYAVLELKLLKDLSFVNIICGIGVIYTVSINFSLLFPYFLQEAVHLTRHDTALCMSTLAAMDLLSRLIVPVITDRFKVTARVTLLSGISLLVVVRFCLPQMETLQSLLIVSGVFGFVRATTVVNQNLCLSEYCSADNKDRSLASALGLTMVAKAVAVISVGQLLSLMRDITNSYTSCLHLQNLLLLCVAICWLPEILYKRMSRCKEQTDAHMNRSFVSLN